MDISIIFNRAAFKHGINEADIRWAVDTAEYDGLTVDEEDAEDKRLLIGFDRNANPLEIMYNIIDENTINIFHAMKCRKIYYHLIKRY